MNFLVSPFYLATLFSTLQHSEKIYNARCQQHTNGARGYFASYKLPPIATVAKLLRVLFLAQNAKAIVGQW